MRELGKVTNMSQRFPTTGPAASPGPAQPRYQAPPTTPGMRPYASGGGFAVSFSG